MKPKVKKKKNATSKVLRSELEMINNALLIEQLYNDLHGYKDTEKYTHLDKSYVWKLLTNSPLKFLTPWKMPLNLSKLALNTTPK
jgi:hypothetical protein